MLGDSNDAMDAAKAEVTKADTGQREKAQADKLKEAVAQKREEQIHGVTDKLDLGQDKEAANQLQNMFATTLPSGLSPADMQKLLARLPDVDAIFKELTEKLRGMSNKDEPALEDSTEVGGLAVVIDGIPGFELNDPDIEVEFEIVNGVKIYHIRMNINPYIELEQAREYEAAAKEGEEFVDKVFDTTIDIVAPIEHIAKAAAAIPLEIAEGIANGMTEPTASPQKQTGADPLLQQQRLEEVTKATKESQGQHQDLPGSPHLKPDKPKFVDIVTDASKDRGSFPLPPRGGGSH